MMVSLRVWVGQPPTTTDVVDPGSQPAMLLPSFLFPPRKETDVTSKGLDAVEPLTEEAAEAE
eukprot:9920900-Prorocentrum_lima.AAC.1